MAEKDKKAPADSGPAFRLVVRIAGLLSIAALILPFAGHFSLRELFSRYQHSTLGACLEDLPAPPATGAGMNYFFVLVFFSFLAMGLYLLLTGKYAGGPLTVLILVNAGGFALAHFAGESLGLTTGYFGMVGPGYYAATAALFAPFIAMFFLDKSI